MTDVTRLLEAADRGDAKAAEQLLPLVYDELRHLAADRLRHEKPGHTLQATALVHEAYLRLVPGAKPRATFNGRGHFFAAAAEAMRRILVESARRKARLKHGGAGQRLELGEHAAASGSADELLDLDEALSKLVAEDAPSANIARLRIFAGLSVDEAADALGISRATAYRNWTYAKAWLRCAMADKSVPAPSSGES